VLFTDVKVQWSLLSTTSDGRDAFTTPVVWHKSRKSEILVENCKARPR